MDTEAGLFTKIINFVNEKQLKKDKDIANEIFCVGR